MLLNVINEFSLNVGLSWNGDWLLHKWLIEVNLIHLQLQLFGNLKWEQGRGEYVGPESIVVNKTKNIILSMLIFVGALIIMVDYVFGFQA